MMRFHFRSLILIGMGAYAAAYRLAVFSISMIGTRHEMRDRVWDTTRGTLRRKRIESLRFSPRRHLRTRPPHRSEHLASFGVSAASTEIHGDTRPCPAGVEWAFEEARDVCALRRSALVATCNETRNDDREKNQTERVEGARHPRRFLRRLPATRADEEIGSLGGREMTFADLLEDFHAAVHALTLIGNLRFFSLFRKVHASKAT